MTPITPEDYRQGRHSDVADRVMLAVGYSPHMVTEIRVDEGRIEVDWIVIDDNDRPVIVDNDIPVHTTLIDRLGMAGM